MSDNLAQDTSAKPLLERMVAARQLSPTDMDALVRSKVVAENEEDGLHWLAKEYDDV